ncbi:uncharacterized protein LOC134442295 [Engraulis encrasicolus]|uniref:uncharacterized protein LOC134442295 n=1 Tax=Engraulis encrasicolus TaxID=184585 RepID=UPI002FD14C49
MRFLWSDVVHHLFIAKNTVLLWRGCWKGSPLSRCLLSEKNIAYLASALTSHSSRLTQLKLYDVSIPDESAAEKLRALENDPHCQMKFYSCVPHPDDPSKWRLSLICRVLEDSEVTTPSAFHQQQSQEMEHYSCDPDGPCKRWLLLSCRVLEDSEVTTPSAHPQQQSQEVSDDNFLKENQAADTLATASSSHSSDATVMYLTNSSQQHTGAQLPSVSGGCVYTVSSAAGSHECSESGLRWLCAGPVTLQYRISKEELFSAQLQMLEYRPAVPLMEIKLLSGELEEVYLPHSLCLGGSDPAKLGDAVRALHGDNSSISLETCELRRFHGRLSARHFSLWQFVVWLGFPVRDHCEVLVYKHKPQPLVLHIYVLPLRSSAKQGKQEKYERSQAILKLPDTISLLMGSTLQLCTSCPSVVSSEVPFTCYTAHASFEVHVEELPKEFDMELQSTKENKPIWKVTMWQDTDYPETLQHTDSQSRVKKSQTDMTEQQQMEVAKLMGGEWKQVGILYLGLSIQELDKIQESERDATMQRFRMLSQWMRQHKGKAGISELHRCLNQHDVPNGVRDCLESMLKGTSGK